MRLNNGKLFPVPVLLPITKQLFNNLKMNSELILFYNNKKVGSISVKSIFQVDLSKHKKNLFGTNDIKHPGYQLLKKMGNYFAGGPIKAFSLQIINIPTTQLVPMNVKEN